MLKVAERCKGRKPSITELFFLALLVSRGDFQLRRDEIEHCSLSIHKGERSVWAVGADLVTLDEQESKTKVFADEFPPPPHTHTSEAQTDSKTGNLSGLTF